VEDNARDIELTLRAFRKARMSNPVHVVRDGVEALDFLFSAGLDEAHPLPGVILLDLNLPKIDGLEVLRRIKADRRTRDIPVIVLTASDRDSDIAVCRQQGVESYIVKPVGFQNFSEVTQRLQMEWALKKPARSRARDS
jgi:CheY-like chemotaxis protein